MQQPTTKSTEEQEEIQENGGPSLFNFLPQPSQKKPAVIEEDDEFLHKKETNVVKPKARITVPSLSDVRTEYFYNDLPSTLTCKEFVYYTAG